MWGQYWSVKNTILGLFDIEQVCQLLQPYIMNTIGFFKPACLSRKHVLKAQIIGEGQREKYKQA